jgi:outer membrane protein assembly factor BamB
MNTSDLLFLGLKSSVTAMYRNSGEIVWTTRLPGGLGESFVTVTCDDRRLYACAGGRLHCLDFYTGEILWSNELTGYGFGIGSICIPGFPSVPDSGAVARIAADRRAAAASSAQ